MNRQNIKLVPTDVGKIEDVVSDILQKKEDKKKKETHINKVLKKDEMLETKKHVHSCPSCQAAFEKKQEGFEICKDCGTVDITIKKGEKLAICNACGGIIPESLVGGDNKACPHCGSDAGARWA
jgi:Zn finger protein HypA/HybF involved in hydrogenase expression